MIFLWLTVTEVTIIFEISDETCIRIDFKDFGIEFVEYPSWDFNFMEFGIAKNISDVNQMHYVNCSRETVVD